MILAAPVVNGKAMTKVMVDNLAQTVQGKKFKLVIVDNRSDRPYLRKDFPKKLPFDIEFKYYPENKGFYYPLIDLYNQYPDELIGLIHNDLLLYEQGWNKRMAQCFTDDPKLGLIGLCGSNEIDQLGGRGAGTMVFFRGAEVKVGDRTYKGQDQAAGMRITHLAPSACLDSLFMMFRRDVIPHLMNERDPWADVTLAHFYDRIWPIRTIEAGYRVATLGVECDHIGGITTTGNMRYREDCIKWLDKRGLPYEDPETEMYLIAERRYLGEYREEKRFLPCIVGADYGIRYLAR